MKYVIGAKLLKALIEGYKACEACQKDYDWYFKRDPEKAKEASDRYGVILSEYTASAEYRKADEALNAVEAGQRVRRIDSVFFMMRYIMAGIRNIEEISCKADMLGMSFTIDPNAQDFPKAYKYTPMSTKVVIERTSSGWVVSDIYRGECQAAYGEIIYNFTKAQKDHMWNYFRKLHV